MRFILLILAFWWSADSGCIMDPLGSCSTEIAPNADEGCHMDPLGGCRG
ncbi:MAG TPA: hypothetical protein VEW48_05280 [Thermoanaerobaculia bacterium]|nr:hypothetical protein [Thermoanaerobaculia bacterium]